MIVTKAPLRISLFGGGTDLPSYYTEHGSTIISFAINLYMHVTWNQRPTGGCRLGYNKVEEVGSLREVEHTLVQACANQYGFSEPCTLTITSDIMKGTGLGSSSSLSIALCKMADVPEHPYPYFSLPEAAFILERSVSPVGIQDHLPAYYGGFRVYNIESGSISYETVPMKIQDLISSHGLLLFTGKGRQAAPILANWKNDIGRLKEIQSLANDVKKDLPTLGIQGLAYYLQHTWKIKSSIKGVVDSNLISQYNEAMNNGALGGKLLGAGGGGCWFFLAHPSDHERIIKSLNLFPIPFEISQTGIEMRTI